MIPQPKFAIGDEVYRADAIYTTKSVVCPDCLGKRVWQVTTPAGESFTIPCTACSDGWCSTGFVGVWEWAPNVMPLTIGSVRVNTADENPIEYMCVETGVGSGTLHCEASLFATYEEAKAAAELVKEQRKKEREAQDARIRSENKKKRARKPSWEERRIKELEAKVKELEGQQRLYDPRPNHDRSASGAGDD